MGIYRRLMGLVVILAVQPLTTAKLVAKYNGDILLGALFPIHQKGNSSGCGALQEDDGIQPVEALMYTLDRINADNTLLPNITLGAIALDSCDDPMHALDQSLDFIKGFLAHMNEHHEQDYTCPGSGMPTYTNDLAKQPVVGVIGDQSSAVTIQVASLLRIFKIPQISYLSTSTTLSNRDKFPYFFRTVPNDKTQANAILEILKSFGWSYVSLVYSDSEYGMKGYETLLDLAPAYNVCFANTLRIELDRSNVSEHYDWIMRRILDKPLAKVVVVFGDKQCTSNLLAAARRVLRSPISPEDRLIWVGSDGWSSRETVSAGQEAILHGAITVQPLAHTLSDFESYFLSLRPQNASARNPWFPEYWEHHFKCRLNDSLAVPHNAGVDQLAEPEPCATGLELNPSKFHPAKYLHFLRDSIYAFAHALHNMHQELCGGEPGLCSNMSHIEGPHLKQYLEKVTFRDEDEKEFKFQGGGDGPPRYTILNFQKQDDDRYVWKEVGTYTIGENGMPKLEIDNSLIQFRVYGKSKSARPRSSCNQQCNPAKGEISVPQRNDTCCPRCQKCGEWEIVAGNHCEGCPLGRRPTSDRSHCVLLPEDIVNYSNPWVAGSLTFAALGVVLTLVIASIFWSNRDTPVIKASGRELSAVLLLGTLTCFVSSFVVSATPSMFTCSFARFFYGFCYTLCFAAIAVKTNRIARIFGPKNGACQRARYTSPKSQLTITFLLTLVEVVINASWLIYNPPKLIHIYPTRESRVLVCDGLDNYSYLVPLIYPVVLMICCTVYAFQTRKCPGGFNEARYIAFTNYTTMVLWLAFIPLYLASNNNVIRVVTLAMSLSITGMVQLWCLFCPKVYIVLFKPEKNSKEGVMAQPQHRMSSYILQTPPNSNHAHTFGSYKLTSSVTNGKTCNEILHVAYNVEPSTADSTMEEMGPPSTEQPLRPSRTNVHFSFAGIPDDNEERRLDIQNKGIFGCPNPAMELKRSPEVTPELSPKKWSTPSSPTQASVPGWDC